MPPDADTRRATAAHLGLYAAAAACLALSPAIHRLHTSDSLIPVLASLYAWEPFFWDQDRVGMVWPLLASPIRHPFANVIAQTAAVLFCTLVVPLLLGKVLFRRPAVAPLAAGVANVWYLGFTPELFIQNHFVSSYHSSATAIACAGLLVLRDASGRWRWVLGGVLLAVAHWVYIAVVFFVLPVAVVRGWSNPGRTTDRVWLRPVLDPRSRAGIVLVLAGFAVGLVLMATAAPPQANTTPTGTLPPVYWAYTMARFLEFPTTLTGSGTWLIGVGVAAVVGATGCVARREWWVLGAAAALFAAGAVEWLVMSTRTWSLLNNYHPRYILGMVSAWQLAAVLLLVAPLAAYRRAGLVTIAVGLGVAIGGGYGVPSAAAVRAVHDAEFGTYTADVRRSGAVVIAGDYWQVWPAAYHINLTRYERGEPPILGSTGRGEPWRRRWVPPARTFLVAMPRGNRPFAEQFCPPDTVANLRPAGDIGRVELYWSDLDR